MSEEIFWNQKFIMNMFRNKINQSKTSTTFQLLQNCSSRIVHPNFFQIGSHRPEANSPYTPCKELNKNNMMNRDGNGHEWKLCSKF